MTREPATSGLIIVDKPPGFTSHDVVAVLRGVVRTRRVGHAGTLDPMATGVLVVGVEKATRLLNHLVLADKSYTATIRLGQSTVTDDAEGELVAATSATHLLVADITAAMGNFQGEIMQVPASVSAIKINGERAYKRAREGEHLELPARPVTVSRFELLTHRVPAQLDPVDPGDVGVLDIDVVVECSSGTYVRALARDLGMLLGVGGHLSALRRTSVGPFTVQMARSLEQLRAETDPVTYPLAAAVRETMPIRVLEPAQVSALSFGQQIEAVGIDGVYAGLAADDTVVALLREDEDRQQRRARPVLVFTAAG